MQADAVRGLSVLELYLLVAVVRQGMAWTLP